MKSKFIEDQKKIQAEEEEEDLLNLFAVKLAAVWEEISFIAARARLPLAKKGEVPFDALVHRLVLTAKEYEFTAEDLATEVRAAFVEETTDDDDDDDGDSAADTIEDLDILSFANTTPGPSILVPHIDLALLTPPDPLKADPALDEV